MDNEDDLQLDEHWKKIANCDIIAFDDPKELFAAAIEYFRWCDNYPIQTSKAIINGKEAGSTVTTKKTRPYTLDGLCVHLGCSKEYLIDVSESCSKESLWAIVVNRIMSVIRVQNIEMSIIGEFNPNVAMSVVREIESTSRTKPVRIEVVQGLPQLATNENDLLEND